MGLVSFVLTLPLAPMRGVISLARVLEQRADEELYDPARVRRRLEEIEEAAASGEISARQATRAQEQVLEPLVSSGEQPAQESADAGTGREQRGVAEDFVSARGGEGEEERGGAEDFVSVRGEERGAADDFVTVRGDEDQPGGTGEPGEPRDESAPPTPKPPVPRSAEP